MMMINKCLQDRRNRRIALSKVRIFINDQNDSLLTCGLKRKVNMQCVRVMRSAGIRHAAEK